MIVVRPGASSAAAINLSTLFFAPVICTSPTSRVAPATLIRSIAAHASPEGAPR